MMTKLFKMMLLLLGLCYLPVAFADAPHSKDYTRPTPSSDFVDNGDGTVTHKTTGLMWMRCSMGQTWTGDTCSGLPSTYNWNEAMVLRSDFAGYSDWRLPTIDELLSIADKGKEKPVINSEVFPNVPTEVEAYDEHMFRSSSPNAFDSNIHLILDFNYGDTDGSGDDQNEAVRLVRGKQWSSGYLEAFNQYAAEEKAKEEREKELQAARDEARQNARTLCEAQKQTCFATCEGFRDYEGRSTYSKDKCEDKCRNISC